MKKHTSLCVVSVLLAACAASVSMPDPKWYEVLPDEKECAIAYEAWASIPPVGYYPLESGWITRKNEETGETLLATYGEHSCESAMSYYEQEWDKAENKRLIQARDQGSGAFVWRQNMERKCICSPDIIRQAKKEIEQIQKKQGDDE